MSNQSKITGTVEIGTETGDKRFYLPGVKIESVCCKCGKPVDMDLSEDYLSYPEIGVPTEVALYCQDDDCQAETEVKVKLLVSLELA